MRSSTLIALAVAASAASCAGSTHPARRSTDATFAGRASTCPRPSTYVPGISPPRGSAGSRVTLRGTLPLYGEDGRLATSSPMTRMVGWWNLASAHWWSALGTSPQPVPSRAGPVLRLLTARVPVPNPCSYRLSFRVPRAVPGVYQIGVVYFGGGGAAELPPAAFRVTR